jgi:hypothetical protein
MRNCWKIIAWIAPLGVEGPGRRLIAVHLQRDPEIARIRESFAGEMRDDNGDQEWHHDRHDAGDDRRHEHRRIAA